ncbi:MAG: ribonuclease P protein component [Candidatus Levybacteria bacterium CG_4_9_14_3_um_filter_35_16]|nr:MAG: ribonuclease P protein component [Candidatus Levybacteria bacterium CG22_combo_CG10-13_8_21_14_all_35_11]PIY94321.1 MAG: ribonuclease P protein component [Candidatus Levybacteria bacterium CG_4_10_14_0_8_um_filter_35_23]PIZ99611.1 MAG: ribonuclease P protein component [Candidatus Levybacteria bacterium CG_4_10_14_0_2_um_filter_35_8]PJA91295.1 MAG: ribonuclease P protein component [Candidatus Levybacteria bacterium CG_4_9_14_3_um_filter_35_16]PJC54239.1 MAG: ribonuclease P protein compon
MLKKRYRLPARTKLSNSLHLLNLLFTLRYAKSKSENNRFVFIVSKKVNKSAVVRNRIRRQMSEAITKLLLKIKPGYDFLFTAKKDVHGKTTEEIYKEIESSLKKTKLIE